MIGRVIQDEWGMSMTSSDEALLTKCVRRYGLPQGNWDGDCSIQDEFARRPASRTSHITAVKISEHNGNDLVATYSNGAIYRFGIRDEEGGLHHVQDKLPNGWEKGSTAAMTGGAKASGRERKRGSSSSSSGFPTIRENPPSSGGKASSRALTASQTREAQRRRLPQDSAPSSGRDAAVPPQASQGPSEQDWRRAFVDEEEDDDDDAVTSGSDSPTEQEAQGFPLYQQLLADGEAGSLDMSSSSSSSDASATSVQEEEEGDSAEWEDVDSDGQAPPRRRRREPNWFNDPEVDDLVIDSDDDSDDDSDEDDGEDSDNEDEEDGDEEFFSDSEGDGTSSSDPDPDVDDPQYAQNVRQASHNYVPIVYPRSPRYVGHLNSETVKEVNFLGPHDEYIVSGSDDGNFFVWDKASGELLGIWEGDGSVVNVVVPHPTLPVLAVSGIDDTVKLFGPVSHYTAGQSSEKGSKDLRTMSRMADKEAIVERNTFRRRRSRVSFGMGSDDDDDEDDDQEEEYEREDFSTRSAIQAALMRASLAGAGGVGEDGEEHPQSLQCGPQ